MMNLKEKMNPGESKMIMRTSVDFMAHDLCYLLNNVIGDVNFYLKSKSTGASRVTLHSAVLMARSNWFLSNLSASIELSMHKKVAYSDECLILRRFVTKNYRVGIQEIDDEPDVTISQTLDDFKRKRFNFYIDNIDYHPFKELSATNLFFLTLILNFFICNNYLSSIHLHLKVEDRRIKRLSNTQTCQTFLDRFAREHNS